MTTHKALMALAFGAAIALSCAPAGADPQPAADGGQLYTFMDTPNLRISGVDRLTITVGPEPQLRITEKKDRFGDIEVDSTAQRLVIDGDDGGWFSDRDYHVFLVVTALEELDFAGAAEISVTEINSGALRVSLSGAAEIDLSGTCQSLTITVAGASEVRAKDLVCARVRIKSAGASELIVHATQQLEVDSAGATDVTYYGKPGSVQKDIAGFGDVSPGR